MGFDAWTTLAAPAGFAPANPAVTASVTPVMMGLGAACTYRAAAGGKVLVVVTCVLNNLVAQAGGTIAPAYGTGAAPVNGAAPSGTLFGGAALPKSFPYPDDAAFTGVLSLVPGTVYWFDLQVATAVGADAAEILNVGVSLAELA